MQRFFIFCLIINLNSTEETLKTFPKTQDLPKLSGRFQDVTIKESHTRNQLLQAQLHLAQVEEGEEEIRQICAEYMEVFKLPGDRITLWRRNFFFFNFSTSVYKM